MRLITCLWLAVALAGCSGDDDEETCRVVGAWRLENPPAEVTTFLECALYRVYRSDGTGYVIYGLEADTCLNVLWDIHESGDTKYLEVESAWLIESTAINCPGGISTMKFDNWSYRRVQSVPECDPIVDWP